jgi:glycosyltransferase involved in cell wall biosynthesis
VVAQLTPWKGQDTAIEALRLVREQGIDARLLLVGSAKFVANATRYDNRSFVADLHAKVERAGLEDRVTWLGEREDIREIVRALDALLLPSWEEPFGRALIEAMALEVPVIATNVGGPPEIIKEGQEGYLVEPRNAQGWAEAIMELAGDRKRSREIGLAGRRRVEEAFTREQHVSRMLEVYRSARCVT